MSAARRLAQQLRPLLAAAAQQQQQQQLGSFAGAGAAAAAAYAVPAVAGPKAGLFGGKRVTTPLSEPLPNVVLPPAATPRAPELQTATLAGGVKAAALDAAGPNTCVAVFVGGGSSIETPETAGASKVLEYLAFSATTHRTTFRLTRELEKYGAATSCVAGREHVAYVVEGTRLQAAEVTEVLLDAVLNQRLADWEVRDMLAKVQEDLEAAYANPALLAHELLHRAAFTGGLSNALLPDPADLAALDGEALRGYAASALVAGNLALTGAGISMDELKRLAEPLLAAAPAGAAPQAPPSSYTGGFLAALSPGAEPTVAVAYEAKGGLSDLKATAAAAVVKALLGAGTREVVPYSSGSDGSGGVDADGPLTSFSPLVQMYRTTGLIGALGTTYTNGAAAAAAALTKRLQALAGSAAGEPALAAAKQLALGGYQSAISARAGVVQDMGLQLLARGAFSAQEYGAAVAGLSAADVSKYVAEVLKSPPTVVAVGGMASLPKYDAVAKALK